MTIVPLSDLDLFIRDSLYEVRRGIANSRNATQANPLLGLMADLPDKINFEIAVTSLHQVLQKSTISESSESSSNSDFNSANETETSAKTERSSSLEKINKNEKSDSLGKSQVLGQTKTDDILNESSTSTQLESDKEKEISGSVKTRNSTVKENGVSQNQKDNGGKQFEIHKEANDRASRTFDEEDGTWGGQGQISAPAFPGGNACTC